MRLVFLLSALAAGLPVQAFQVEPVCEPWAAVSAVLLQADAPRDGRRSLAEHNATIRAIFEKALAGFPEDPFLHAAFQDFELGGHGEARPQLIEKYLARLAERPKDANRQYLAARALYSSDTPRALALVQELLTAHPDYGPALLLEARIRTAKSFLDPGKAEAALERFTQACPAAPAAYPELHWLPDAAFLARHSERLRKQLSARADLTALRAYPALWATEKASRRSDEMAAVLKQWEADIERLRGPQFPRSRAWLDALWNLEFLMEKRFEWIPEEFARQWPHAWPSQLAAIRAAVKLGPTAEAFAQLRELGRTYPALTGLGSYWYLLAEKAQNDGGTALAEAYQYMKNAMDLDPESYQTLPPFQIEMAAELVKRRVRLDLVPQFVFAGLEAGNRSTARESRSDLYPSAEKVRQQTHDWWYLFGYCPLIEAYSLQGKFAEARDILSQAQIILERQRPAPEASPEERGRFGMFEASFWRVKGAYAEKQGKKLDALIAYRNALLSYPPRTARPDEREEVLAAARRLARELGGSDEGWNDWEARQPLANLASGDGGPNAWIALARKRPGLKVTDMRGREFMVEELARNTSFVNVWATWCMPCRAELPYLEKLAARYRDRDDVIFVALNVDEDTSVVKPFLKQFHFGFETALAGGYAYDFLPVFGVPANYIIGKQTRYFSSSAREDAWVDAAAAALKP